MAFLRVIPIGNLSIVGAENIVGHHPADRNLARLVLQRWADEEGVFFLEEDWNHLKQVTAGIAGASTWAEFEDALPPGEFDLLLQWRANGGEHLYRRDRRIRYRTPGTPHVWELEESDHQCVRPV